MAIDADRRRKLVGLLGRLGSDNDNERLAAVRLIEAGRKALGMQWEDLIVQPVTIMAHVGPLDFNTARPARPSVKPSAGKVCDLYDDPNDFADLVCSAEGGASTSKEMDFVSDMSDRLRRYGVNTFVSEAQLAWLRALADRA